LVDRCVDINSIKEEIAKIASKDELPVQDDEPDADQNLSDEHENEAIEEETPETESNEAEL